MSNSNMVSYTKISPNKNAPRNHAIDTITIHHCAGKLSVEDIGRIFADPKKKGSSNYGIGTDGRVGMYVEEKDRAWTSSSASNDNRAITIEVANSTLAPNWEVSDKVMGVLIDLVTDICKRNNIKKLVWSNTKTDRTGHKNGCNMTIHKDFAATACPGPYLEKKMSYIADEVNKKLNGEVTPTPAPTPSAVPLKVTDATAKGVQKFLNTYYNAGLAVDGSFGTKSKQALAKAFQIELNNLGAGIGVDGSFGPASEKAFTKYVGTLKQGMKGSIFITLWQCLLVGFGYNPNGIDGSFGAGCTKATNAIFADKKLSKDSIVNGSDINALI